ncbi:DUF4126 domain-containing protein [Methyloversatilis thermotolerans]|uniref:DUF4126 domain-containing protein n=1 Tax=Methyloversatilis thermotolerans TaxID=1346290 RepID=UPI00037FE7EA|nr:DUF4126 domain-containing protein [Methyloversatilis thermotolerans]
MDVTEAVAAAAGLAWASGLRPYAVVFLAGLAGRMEWFALPGELDVLEHPVVMGVAGLLMCVEFLADKMPALDSLWDALHTFIRIPVGALLAAWALADQGSAGMFAGALLGGTLSGATHLTKAGGRLAVNASPEPLSNLLLSAGEDGLALTGLWLAFVYPLAFLILLALFVIMLWWLLPRMWRFLTGLLSWVSGKQATG